MPEPSPSPSPSPTAPAEVHSSIIVTPQETNNAGNLFGGALVAHIDKLAAMACVTHCRTNVVTASIDQVDFLAPVRMGHFVHFKARLCYVGRTSMEVLVSVQGEDPRSGERHAVCEAQLTFVALDAAGVPTPVPPLVAQTPEQRARFEKGRTRALARQQGRRSTTPEP